MFHPPREKSEAIDRPDPSVFFYPYFNMSLTSLSSMMHSIEIGPVPDPDTSPSFRKMPYLPFFPYKKERCLSNVLRYSDFPLPDTSSCLLPTPLLSIPVPLPMKPLPETGFENRRQVHRFLNIFPDMVPDKDLIIHYIF